MIARGIRRLKRAAKQRLPLRIVVGSSDVFEEGWIPTEVDYLNLLHKADWERFFSSTPVDAILAEHVWEHLAPEEGRVAAKTCFEFLSPGGHLRIAVPDGFNPDPAYRDWVRPGGSGAGADDHKVLYTHESLARLLTDVGFTVELLEYYDAAGTFHYTDWNPADGMIHRSRRFDERNQRGKLGYTSLIVDARKPMAPTA